MADLDAFLESPQYSLDSFSPEKQPAPSYINETTAKSDAAHAVALAGPTNSTLNTYDTVAGELGVDNKSALFESIKQAVATGDQQRLKEQLPGIVGDPTVPDSVKRAAVTDTYSPDSEAYNAANLVSRRALGSPSPHETPEGEGTQIDIAAAFRKINAVKAQKQALYNNFVAKNDPSVGSKIGAALGGMIPLSHGGQTQALVGDVVPDASWWDRLESAILPGEGKQKIIDYLTSLPLDQQVAATQHVLDALKTTTGILPDTSNNANMVANAAQFALDGNYQENSGRTMDNIFGLLDVAALGGMAAGAVKATGAARIAAEGDSIAAKVGDIGKPPGTPPGASGGASEAFRESASRDFTRSSVQPSSVSQNLKDVNPEQFRLTHQIAANDATDESAQALYGTTRNEAIANDIAPEVAHPDGSVNAKVSEPDFTPENALDPEIASFVNNSGMTALTKEEKARTSAAIVNNFADAMTPSPRTEMYSFGGITSEEFPEGVRMTAVYAPNGHGYADPDEARDLFKWVHRDSGITDKDITILERRGSQYYPYEPQATGVQNNASGESSASVEAMNRNASEKDNAQLRFLIDRNDIVTPLIGVDAVDTKARPGQLIVQQNVGKDKWTVLSSGDDLSKDVIVGKLNRNLTKLTDAANRQDTRGAAHKMGDFLVQVTHEYRYQPGDIEGWYDTSVKRNFFDTITPHTGGEHGTLTQHLFPSTSVMDPVLSLSSLTTADRAAGLEKLLLKPFKDFNKIAGKLQAERYNKLMAKLQDANLAGYTPSKTNLMAEGFTEEEIKAANIWRKFWDNNYWLDNADYIKSARARGHKIFVDTPNGTYLEVKPQVQRGNIKGSVDIADPKTGSLKSITPKDIDFIYERGGMLGELETPVKIGDEFATHVISMETPDHYFRAINDGDMLLAYRPGYFNVSYKGPWFIDRVWKDANGNVKNTQTVASSDNKKDADLLTTRLDKSTDDGSTHVVRLDKKRGNYQRNNWELYKASGRSSQRFRGARLVDATSNLQGPGHGHILNPIEAAVKAARSISKRTTLRDWLEMTKTRYINNNGKYLPKNEFGHTVFPADRRQIEVQSGVKGNKKGLAKARSEFDFIRAMENGYVNSIDDFWKASLNNVADILGEKHITLGEKTARNLADKPLTARAKKISFSLFLALNPVRQLLIQAHQGILLAAINPGWFTTRGAGQIMYLLARQIGMGPNEVPEAFFRTLGMTRKQADQMFKDLEASGLAAGVDKHSIVRGSLNDMADMMVQNSARSALSKTVKPFKTLAHYSRLLGFDAGEWFNIVSAWAANRDLAIKSGEDITRSDVRSMIAARARNFTGSMNAAGDMPYNSNELNVLLQFQQQGHKMFSLMTTNRAYSRAERMRLLGFTTIMWGIPTSMGGLLWAALSNDNDSSKTAQEKAKAIQLLQRGAEDATLNRLASAISGDKVDLDFSSLNPLNMYGTGELIHSLFTSTPGEIVANTPTGSLFFGGNPRLTKFVKTTAQFFHLQDNNDVPVTFSQEAMAFAKLSSGFSNAFQAAYTLKYGQAISTYSGNVTDPEVSTPEAMGKFFGFSTWDSVQKAAENQEFYQASQDFENDVNTWYRQYRSDLSRDDITPDEIAFVTKMHTKAFAVWGDNDRAYRIIESNLLKDAAKGDLTFYKRAISSAGIMNYQDWRQLVLNTNQVSDDTKQQILKIGELFQNNPPQNKQKDAQ